MKIYPREIPARVAAGAARSLPGLTAAASQQGSVLLVTLFIATLFGMFLFSYLYLVRTQNTLVARSQAWNGSLNISEAGIEEALAQLNPEPTKTPVVDRSANGWGAPSGNLYGPVTRTFSNSTYSVVYTTDLYPVLYSTGYVTVPYLNATLTRTVRVTTTNVPLFNVAMAALGNINLNGNAINTDSFNSTLPTMSSNGLWVASKASTNGNVASLGGIVNVGNANVNGTIFLGPTATNTIKNNGVVTGGVTNDFNASFPDVVLPQTSWLAPSLLNTLIGTVTYNYAIMTTGDYTINNLNGSLYIGTNAVVRLKLTGNATPSTIIVAGPSAGARLSIFMDGPSFTLSGSSTVDGGVAMNLAYYGTTNNTSITFGGNASFIGTIYAPEANFTLGGGGASTYDFSGSSITKTVTINGHFNFHFDEGLLSNGPARGYAATTWTEL